MWLQICLLSSFNVILSLLLPSGVIFWLLNKLLWHVIILELNFLKMCYLCITRLFLLSDIKFLNLLPIIGEFSASFKIWLDFSQRMSRVSSCNSLVVICIYHDTTLL